MPDDDVTPEREIDWIVRSVFATNDDEVDFAYTIGLAAHGVPELHVWARPPVGDDPGADWRLSSNDQAATLNGAAHRLLDGDIGPGSTWVETLDGGLTEVAYEVVGPVEPASVDAFGVSDDAEVLTLQWELRRPPEPDDPFPIDESWSAETRLLRRRIVRAASMRDDLFGDVAVPGVGDLPLDLSPFDEVAEVVGAVRSAIRRSDGVAWALLDGNTTFDLTRWAGGVVVEAARALGRRSALEKTRTAAEADARAVATALAEPDDDEFTRVLEGHLGMFLSVAYGGLLVIDALDDRSRYAATGWLLAVCDPISAQERFDSWAPATSEMDVSDGPPTDDGETSVVELLGACAVSAASGMGAPMCDDNAVAWARLAPIGPGQRG